MTQEILELKVKELKKSVQMLSHELIVKQNFSENLVQHLELLEILSDREIRNIEAFIKTELEIKSTGAHLQNLMGKLSSNFYNELKINHPDLIESELKLAGMVIMKMSNKEIGINKNTTWEGAKKAKSRLKKKLNVSSNNDLFTYLETFL